MTALLESLSRVVNCCASRPQALRIGEAGVEYRAVLSCQTVHHMLREWDRSAEDGMSTGRVSHLGVSSAVLRPSSKATDIGDVAAKVLMHG